MLHTLLYFLALICLSTSPNWAKLNHMPVEILGFWRLAIAAVALGTWAIFSKTLTLKSQKWIHFRWVILSGVFFFLHLWTYKYASKTTTVSNTMILFASNPLWASVGGAFFFQERITGRLIISYLLAVLGIYILVHHQIEFSEQGIQGDISALISAAFYSAYMLTGKKARQHVDNTTFSFVQYSVCAVCFAFTALYTQNSFAGYDSISWISVAGLVLLPTFLGHFTLTYLVKHMNLTVLSCGKLLEPIFASIMAYFVFHEQLETHSWIAFLLTSAGVFILFAPGLFKKSARANLKNS